jgi:flagellin-like hook-associated protein FlgL
MYNTTMRNLQRNAGKLNKLDEQISSGKRINRPSDNPVGFSQSMGYKNSTNALAQNRVNMDDGQAYMNTLERTHQSMNGLFGNSRDLAVSAANDTMKHSERLIIHLDIRRNLEQLVALSQTRHKDGYIFSGTWTNQPPYEIKKAEVSFKPTMYNGIDNPNFSYLSPTIARNPNNPKYDPPTSTSSDITDPSTWPLFKIDEPVEIRLYDNAYLDLNLKPPNYPEAQRIIPGSFELEGLVEKPGKNTDFSHLIPPLSEEYVKMHPDYDKPDYEIDYAEGKITLLSDKAKAAFYNYDGTLKDPADPRYSPSGPFDPNYDPYFLRPYNAPPTMTFEYIYKNSNDMSGDTYRELEASQTMKVNMNPDTLFGVGTSGETDSFKELIHLMQGLWYNDQSNIAEGIDTVNAARTRNLEQQTVTGSRQNRMDSVYDRNLDLAINETGAINDIESVDLADVLSQFSMADAVYNASLYSASQMMKNSLMNYL